MYGKDVTVVSKKLGRKCTQFGETHVIAFTAFLFQKYRNPMPMTKWQKIWQHDINVKRRIIFTNFVKVKPNVYLGLTLKSFPLKMFDFQTYFNILFLLTWNLQVCVSMGNLLKCMGHMKRILVAITYSTCQDDQVRFF